MSPEVVLNLFMKICIMVAFGFFLKKWKVIQESLQRGLTDILVRAILPVSILSSAHAELTAGSGNRLVMIAVISAAYYLSALFLVNILAKILPLKKSTQAAFVSTSVFANVGFIGFPLVSELFGSTGMMYAAVYNMLFLLFFFTYGVSRLSGYSSFKLKTIYTNPATIASLLSIALFLSPFRLPEAVSDTLSTIGDMVVPLSMLLIGSILADISPSAILRDINSYIVSFLRLIFFPAVMLLLLKAFGVSRETASLCVIMTALPSASLNAMYAEEYHCEPEFVSRAVAQSMIFMVVTIPAVITLITAVYG